ncbi:MAG: hypothetical protein JRF40_10800 [Deltaproteobacteria bacterium]|nr:hypothetical protein [Deltaproteobacteria bacterium]
MKIVNCPKGGRIPEGYCKESCLNYEEKHHKKETVLHRGSRNPFISKKKSWLQIYKEDVLPRLKDVSLRPLPNDRQL